MKKFIAIIVMLSLTSIAFSQESIDTVKYIKETEREFILQLNQYRRSLNIDTLKTEDSLHFLCFLNNERLSKEDKVIYNSFVDNKEAREFMHRGFKERFSCYYLDSVTLSKPGYFCPIAFSEICIHGWFKPLVTQSPKKTAKIMLELWIGSHDHNQILIDNDYETVNIGLKFFTDNYGRFTYVTTSVFKTKKDPNLN